MQLQVITALENKRQFPYGMTGKEIREAHDLDQEEIRQKFGQRPVPGAASATTAKPGNKPKVVVLEVVIPKAAAQRASVSTPPKTGASRVMKTIRLVPCLRSLCRKLKQRVRRGLRTMERPLLRFLLPRKTRNWGL